MKRYILTLFQYFIVALLIAFLLPIAWAQSPEAIAQKYGISFPVAELGNCSNYSECRGFCEDPVNYNQCIDFAKKKGFYNEEKVKLDIRNSDFWSGTQTELGCNSIASCQSFCENPSNFDKCDSFAKKHSLNGGHVENTHEQQFLEKAKEILGCDSPSSCMAFCENQENFKKCSEFAKQIGFRGGEIHAGPGGCTSEETCRAFCSDPNNYQICSSFTSSAGGSFSGPGGCNSEESCRLHCQQHPQECGYIRGGTGADYNPSEMCSRTPDCSWVNNSCQCTKIEGLNPEDYCKKYPDHCGGYTGDPASECAKYPGCSWNNNACQCSAQTGSVGATSTYDPKAECSKYPGCSWDGSTCQCSGSSSGTHGQPTGTSYEDYCKQYPEKCSGASGSTYDPVIECTKQTGCSWTGSTCHCSSESTTTQSSGGSTYDPATECAKQSGCSWTGSTCYCGQ